MKGIFIDCDRVLFKVLVVCKVNHLSCIQMGENDEDASIEEGSDFQIAMYRWQSILNLKTALPMIPDFKELS